MSLLSPPVNATAASPCRCDCCDVRKVYQIIEENTTDIGASITDISNKLNSEYIKTFIFMTVTNGVRLPDGYRLYTAPVGIRM